MTATPTPGAPSLAFGEDTGASDSDGVINLSGPLLIGQTVPNATITLYDNNVATTVNDGNAGAAGVANALADANGDYAILPDPALDDGKHTLTITATAPGETASQFSAPLYIVVDTSVPDPPPAPVLANGFDSGASAEDGITDQKTLVLTGSSEPGTVVKLYNNTDADGDPANGDEVKTFLAQATAAADGSYTITTGTLLDGAYKLTVTATDLAGNVGKPSAETAITIDSVAPAAPAAPTLSPGTDTGVLHNDGLTDNSSPVITGTAEANATVSLYDENAGLIGKGTADASGNYAITSSAPLADGAHAILAVATDVAGNVSTQSPQLNIVVDTQAATGTSTADPATAALGQVTFDLHFSEPVAGLTAQALQLTATGTASGQIGTIKGTGSDYTVTVGGVIGDGTLQVGLATDSTVTDLAGNPATLTASPYAVDDHLQPQTITIATIGGGSDDAIGLSAGGRLVAFDSGDLLTNAASGAGSNVYVADALTGGLSLVSGGMNGAVANGTAGFPSLSADGKTIVFVSTASNLVANGPTDGSNNVYVAHLSTSNLASGQAVTVTDIELVSSGNGHDGIDDNTLVSAPAISADGAHVAFVSDQPLIAGVQPGYNVYEKDLTTGVLTLISAGSSGTGVAFDVGFGGDAVAQSVSLSSDGTRVAYLSDADNLVPALGALSSGVVRTYVYDAATGTTTGYYGADQLGITGPGGYLTVSDSHPEISANGKYLTYSVQQMDPSVGAVQDNDFVVEQTLATGAIQALTPDNVDDYEAQSPTINAGGRYITYEAAAAAGGSGDYVIDSVTGTTTFIANAEPEFLSNDGNAVAYTTFPDADGSSQVILQTLGPVVGVDAVGNDNRFDASAWHEVQADGLLVTGESNQTNAATVTLTLSDSTGTVLMTLTKIAVSNGAWSATIPAAELTTVGDGTYLLSAIASGPEGASFPAGPAFVVDTMPPATPEAPKLDAGSDTSTASDGSATNQDMPILTGTAEAGATVTLYDTSSASPTTPIGTAIADSQGVYAIAPSAALINGKHTLDVTATDTAGNVSAASDGVTFTVDTLAPATPPAPTLAPTPTADDQFGGTSIDESDGAPVMPPPVSDTGASDTDGITSNTTPNVVGTAEAGTTVTLYDTDGVAILGTAKVGADGKYTIAASNLSEGMHEVTVKDTDDAGNVSPASAPLAVTIDTLPPLQPIISSVTGPLVSGKITALVTVNGTAEPGSKVQLVLDGGMTSASIFGESTAESDGAYSISSDPLPAGDGQNLTVIATDVAGNASQPSLPVDVDITNSATPPPGVPPFTPTLIGLLTDGRIAGATVFADTNGNGTRDTDEGSGLTDANGQFELTDTGGELIATGGTDTATGLGLPGALTAPAHATVIDPLTTLLDAYATATGQTPEAAQPALLGALGLDTTVDLTQLDPTAAAASDTSFLVADARVMDSVVTLADVIAAQTGVATSVAFSSAFDALAQAAEAAAPTLDLDSSAVLQAIAAGAAATAAPGTVLPNDVLNGIGTLLAQANGDLAATTDPQTGVSGQGYVDAVERIAQGQAAPALAEAGSDANAIDNVLNTFVYGFSTGFANLAAAETVILAPPTLAAGQDTGLSSEDNVTEILDPVFTGAAPPGATVILAASAHFGEGAYQIVGSGTADVQGIYRITATLGDGGGDGATDVVAIQAQAGADTTLGSSPGIPQPVAYQTTQVLVGDNPDQYDDPIAPPTISAVGYVAAAGDDAGHVELLVSGSGKGGSGTGPTYESSIITVTADGSPVPIGSAIGNSQGSDFNIVTSPLSAGTHTLVATQTFLDGETLQGPAYTVDVAPPDLITLTAEAAGPIAGGKVYNFAGGDKYGLSGFTGADYPDIASFGATDATGTVILPNQPDVGGLTEFSTSGALLTSGEDTLTGLPLPGILEAPGGSTVITPLTTFVSVADADAANPDAPATPAQIAFEDGRVGQILGLSPAIELRTADPLAIAEAGDPSVLLKNIELLDTVTLLTPFVLNAYTSIDEYAGITLLFDLEEGVTPQPVKPVDFTSAAEVLAWMTTDNSSGINGNYDTTYDSSVLPVAAAIIAASNAAIEAHAKIATDPADDLSYSLAVERVALGAEAGALGAAGAATTVPGMQADFTALQTEYTGAGLNAAIAAALDASVQVTGFAPSATSTGQATEDFTLTFSSPVAEVSTSDFSVSAASSLIGAYVRSVTAVAGSGGTAYDVSISTGLGQGALTVGFTPNGITAADGRPLAAGLLASPQVYASPSLGESVDTPALAVAVGNFHGDGIPDIVAGFSKGLTLYTGQGNGTFVAQPSVFTGLDTEVERIVTGDFNGDGKLDVLLLGPGEGDPTVGYGVSVLLGNGDGTFQAPIRFLVGNAVDVTVGDYNGDGKLDLAVLGSSETSGEGTVQVYLGNGDGTFTPGSTVDVGGLAPLLNQERMVSADLNGDGKPDLVVDTVSPDGVTAGVSVLVGDGHGGFTLADQPALGVATAEVGIAVGDLNGDGVPDIVAVPEPVNQYVTAESDATISVLLGRGDGTFQPAVSVPLPLPPDEPGELPTISIGGVAIGDVTGDGKPDAVINDVSIDEQGTVTSYGALVLPGHGDGTFGTGYFTGNNDTGGVADDQSSAFALADLNGDRLLDLVSTGTTIGGTEDSGVNSQSYGIAVSLNSTATVLSASATVTVDRAAVASPMLSETSGGGTFTHVGNAYMLDLGALTQGSDAAAVLALVNAATGSADSFDGEFSGPSGSGFALTGATLAAAIAAGQSQGGITLTADTGTPGIHSETITFAPRDTTAAPAEITVPDGDSGTIVAQTLSNPDAVADELPALTLTVTDDVVAGVTPAPAILGPVAALVLPNVRVGSTDSQTITISNTAVAPAADLDVTATASGGATVSGSVLGLAAQASDMTSLTVGLDTSSAGTNSGTVALTPVSEPETALADQNVAVSGAVYQEATASIAPIAITVHVGDPGSVALPVMNTDAADGFSEALIATITGVTAGLSIASAGPTADIVAGATDTSSLAIGFFKATAQTITGSASVALMSDGGTGAGSVDGLGQAALAAAAVPITITVDNYAQPDFTSVGGVFTPGATPGTWVLNLGTITQGAAALSADLSVLNAAQGPADLLGGSYTVAGGSAFTNTGFGAFTGLAANGSADAGSVSLSTSHTGTFSETLTLTPSDTEGSGTPTALAPQTVTVTGTVAQPTGSGIGDVHLTTFDGLHYNFQANGDFMLAQSTVPGDSFQVQIRTTPFANIAGTSIITEAAAQVGSTVVAFGMGGTTVAIDGVADTALSMANPMQLMDGGTLRMIAANEYALDWSTGESITVTKGTAYLNVTATLGAQDAPGSVQGLLGSDTGQAGDFALPDGTVLKQPLSSDTLLGTFANAWTVAPGQSLLGGTVPAASGLGAAPAMTFLNATAPGQILTGSLLGGAFTQPAQPGVTICSDLASLAADSIVNFSGRDLIDIANFGSAGATAIYQGSSVSGELHVADGSASSDISLTGNIGSGAFSASSDGHGGTIFRQI